MFIANLIITFSGAVQNWNKKASDYDIGQSFCAYLKAAPRKVGVCIVKYLFLMVVLNFLPFFNPSPPLPPNKINSQG